MRSDRSHDSEIRARVFDQLYAEAVTAARCEPLLADMLEYHVISQSCLEDCLITLMASTLADQTLSVDALTLCFQSLYQVHPSLVTTAAQDMSAVIERDAASSEYLPVLLYLKGFQALQSHRLAHALWHDGRRMLARSLHHRTTQAFGIDIHPACRIGHGVMLDHGTGIVIGETAEIGDNVSIMQGVTLGGTGKESGDRHPKVRSGVLIGAGATVLGNVEIGYGAQVGAGSVVLAAVEEHTTVVGIPARQAGRPRCPSPSVTMEHGSFQYVADPQWYQQGS